MPEARKAKAVEARCAKYEREPSLAMIEGIGAVVWRIDPRTRQFTYVSPRAQTLLGHPVERWLADPSFWANMIVHEDDRDRATSLRNEGLAEGRCSPLTYRARTADGRVLWLKDCLQFVTDDEGRSVLGVTLDMTAEKEAEQALARRNRELEGALAQMCVAHREELERTETEAAQRAVERSARELDELHRELEQFAYIASHDLRTPLRGIASLAHWIEEDLEGRIPKPTREHFDFMKRRVKRLEAMIDGLLEYSRTGRSDAPDASIDLAQLVGDLADLLQPREGQRIDADLPLPIVCAPRLPFMQVLRNLLANGLKHGGAQVAVSVSARTLGNGWWITVRDDGPGIDARHHDRIWTMFQTLRPRDQVEGTGIGLSIVKKIVERRGGRVELASAPGDGCAFSFFWPDSAKTESRTL